MSIISNVNIIPVNRKIGGGIVPPSSFKILLEGVSGDFVLTEAGPTNYVIQE